MGIIITEEDGFEAPGRRDAEERRGHQEANSRHPEAVGEYLHEERDADADDEAGKGVCEQDRPRVARHDILRGLHNNGQHRHGDDRVAI